MLLLSIIVLRKRKRNLLHLLHFPSAKEVLKIGVERYALMTSQWVLWRNYWENAFSEIDFRMVLRIKMNLTLQFMFVNVVLYEAVATLYIIIIMILVCLSIIEWKREKRGGREELILVTTWIGLLTPPLPPFSSFPPPPHLLKVALRRQCPIEHFWDPISSMKSPLNVVQMAYNFLSIMKRYAFFSLHFAGCVFFSPLSRNVAPMALYYSSSSLYCIFMHLKFLSIVT